MGLIPTLASQVWKFSAMNSGPLSDLMNVWPAVFQEEQIERFQNLRIAHLRLHRHAQGVAAYSSSTVNIL